MRVITGLPATASLIAALFAAASASAAVTTVPDATYFVRLEHHEYYPKDPEYHNNQQYTAPGNYAFPGLTAVQAGIGGAPLSARSHAAAGLNTKSFVDAGLIYYFEIIGPADGVSVPLSIGPVVNYRMQFDDFHASENAQSTGISGYVYNVGAVVDVNAQTHASAIARCAKAAYASPTCTATHSTAPLFVSALTGATNQITVSTNAYVDTTNSSPGITLDAFADPLVAFAPGFDATGYSIVLSAGVANALPVPEPQSYALLAVGMVALALALRRARA